MKECYFTRVILLTIWIFSLAAFAHVEAQTAPPEKQETGAPRVKFTYGNRALKVPLEIDNNIILMRVRVNGSRPLKFIFDTGANHSIIDSKRAAELGLKTQGQASGTATGGRIEGTFVTGVALGVSGAEVSDQLIGVIPFPTVPGFEYDGVLGYDFIRQFVIEIDYLKKMMNLYNPKTYAYRRNGRTIPLLLTGRRTPLVVTQITLDARSPMAAKLEVDTGADGTFVMYYPFVKEHELLAAMPKTVQDRGAGLGGEQSRLLGEVKAVRLGRFLMKNVPMVLSLDTVVGSEDGDGVVGGEILRRFKVILDYSRQRMILEPNKSFNDRFEVERGGD